jgi:Flp pilus assembly protein TadB
MNITSLPILAAGLCALIAGVGLYQLFPIEWSSNRDARQTQRLLSHAYGPARTRLPFWRAVLLPLHPLMRRIPGANLAATERQLFWVQLSGQLTSWTAEEIWAMRMAGAVIGLVLGLSQPPGLGPLLLPIILFLLPGQRLDTAYSKVSRRVRREIPEFAQAIALQSALGKSIPEALRQMTEADTTLARFFGYAQANRPTGPAAVALLNTQSNADTPGWLLQQAQQAGLKEVAGLVARLEKAARRGVEVDVLLGDVADLAASDYNAEVATRAQQLDGKLSVPLMLGIFLPYVVFMIAPFMQNFGELLK